MVIWKKTAILRHSNYFYIPHSKSGTASKASLILKYKANFKMHKLIILFYLITVVFLWKINGYLKILLKTLLMDS